MSKRPERSRSMSAFADVHGDPDAETTARMRERLQRSLHDQDLRRRRRRDRLAGAVVAGLVVAVLGVAAWQAGWLAPADDGTDARGVLRTADAPQRLERPWGEIVTAAHTLVRLDDAHTVELVEGRIELHGDDTADIVVRVGAYEVRTRPGAVAIERTSGVPLVTVHRGAAELRGPDLPAAGVRLSPGR